MQEQQWRRISQIFHSALRLDAHHRAAFLEQTCSGNEDLRVHVNRLLANHIAAESFLEQPAIELALNANGIHPDRAIREGELVLHYRIGAKLGSGGMGEVYEADDLKLGRKVALKFLFRDLEKDGGRAAERLLAEARAASSLNHPNICTIHAIEEYCGRSVLVMELLEGHDLRQWLRAGVVDLEDLVRTGLQACEALGAAHAKSIVHRDIKPANLFAASDGRLKLLDFGVAKWMRVPEPNGRAAETAGTILYMSPEQLRGENVDGRSDLFSLGTVLYELATGVHPFARSSTLHTINALLTEQVSTPSRLNPALPRGFDLVIGQMLEKDRERRYDSAPATARALQLLQQQPSRAKKRKLASAAAGLLLLCGTGIYFLQHQKPLLTIKDTIVLADVQNGTNDPKFNQMLRSAMAMELRQSPFLSLISEARIQHILRLMAKPPDTKLDAEVAREICERTESTAVLEGGIIKGNKYVVYLRARNCSTGELLYSERTEAARDKDILRGVSLLARNFRQRAGESVRMIAKHSPPVLEGTTPSLEAWRFFSEGMRLAMLQGHTVAIPMIKRAIAIDPQFATALAMLGRDYSAIGEMESAREYTERAFQERDHASDQERFFIDYSYHRLVTGDLEKALQTCAVWTGTYPRDPLGHALCAAAARVLGRFELTVEEDKKCLEADPDQPYPYAHLAGIAVYRNDYAEAHRWLDRASARKLTLPDFQMIRHQIAFLQANQAELERVGTAAESLSEIQDWIWGERGQVLAFSGHLKQARAMSERAVEVAMAANRSEAAAQHEGAAAVREALFGNRAEARRNAVNAQGRSRGKDAEYGTALAFAFAGELSRAEALTKDLEQRYPEDTIVQFSYVPTLRAIASIKQGEPSKALEWLAPAARYELGWLGCCSVGFVGSLYPIYVRGDAYLALHRWQDAAAEFERLLDHRGIVGSNPIALLAHWKRGKALAEAGRRAEAEAEYRHFLSLWHTADADIPLHRSVRAEYDRLLTKN